MKWMPRQGLGGGVSAIVGDERSGSFMRRARLRVRVDLAGVFGAPPGQSDSDCR